MVVLSRSESIYISHTDTLKKYFDKYGEVDRARVVIVSFHTTTF